MTALPPDAAANLRRVVADLERELQASRAERDDAIKSQAAAALESARLQNALNVARDRQNASADILRSIAAASGEAEGSLYQIAETSMCLFGATSATIQIAEGDGWSQIIRVGDSSKRIGAGVPEAQLRIGGRNMPGTIVAENRQVHVPDLDNVDPAIADWPGLPYARAAGTRSMSGSPLRREGNAIGTLIVYRDRLAPFTEEELALQQSFADQAAIAIENARLFNETREALERQTATADVLKVISRSAFDLQAVLETLTESAGRLCDAEMAFLMRREGEVYRAGAAVGYTDEYIEFLKNHPIVPDRGTITGRVVLERRTVQILDVATDPEYTLREATSMAGQHTALGVPLMRGNEPIGTIVLARRRVQAFTPKQVELVTTFADQAVIAIENVRLFNETREALERQTATADILKVIASSPSDVQPVFEAIASSSKRLVGGFSTAVFRFVDGMAHLAAYTPISPAADEVLKASFPRPVAELPFFDLANRGEVVQEADTEANPDAGLKDLARARGFRSVLLSPLMSKGAPIGLIVVTRKEPGRFAEHHVQLMQTFADQAVIAIENVRLFEEVQAKTRDLSEALTYQTGSGNILRVIASSPTDVKPVLEAIVQSACDLCGADDALVTLRTGDDLVFQAQHGSIPVVWDRQPINRQWTAGRAVVDRETVHVPDLLAPGGAEFPGAREFARRTDVRTVLAVPLLSEGESIGAIVLRRTEVQPFSNKQIALLQTFADQAVIAIGNVRLFEQVQARTRDLSEALQQQTATADVLKVISRSAFDLQSVLDTLVNSASTLCSADQGMLLLLEDGVLKPHSYSGPHPDKFEFRKSLATAPHRGNLSGRAVLDGQIAHVADVLIDPEFTNNSWQELTGFRAMLAVPLMRQGQAIGAMALSRTTPGLFADRQIELVTTFADQAVIAIENVRLFDEVQAKTRDLTESLQQQTATGDVLKVIASSPTDVEPALKAIVESACALCDAYDANVLLKIGDDLHFSAHHGPIPTGQQPRAINRQWVTGRSVVDKVPVQVSDFHAPEAAEFPEGQRQSREQGHRCTLSVPLLREGEAIGAVVLRRLEPVAFSEKQLALLQTFADQAVIAIGNVRLFDEVQARTRDLSEALTLQTATADVLKVISRSAFDLQKVLDTLSESATRLCEADIVIMHRRIGDAFRGAASFGLPEDQNRAVMEIDHRPGRGSLGARVLLENGPVLIDDAETDPEYTFGAFQRRLGMRSMLGVPLMREGAAIGLLLIFRKRVQPFTERHVDLATTFADQAVIAMENVRLFDEVQARTRELAASLDDLRTAQGRLIQTEKLASLGQLTAGIAHEIKNPLNFVNNFAALSAELTDELNDVLRPAALDGKVRDEVDELTGMLKDNLEKVVQHGKRADSIVKNMLLHSREGSGDHRPADINALLDESLNLAYHGARAERPAFNVTLQRDFDAAAGTVEVFPQEITRVLLNLIANGFYAVAKRKAELGESGFDPILRASTKSLGDTVEIRIRDNGTGIPSEVRDKMFNPFFTTKPAGEGTGLGLSMSHDIIVKQHGGSIGVETEPGQFTEFIIVLPRASNPSSKNRGQT